MLASVGTAQADAFWFGSQTARPLGNDGWYVGTGGVVGLFQLPTWNAPIVRFPGELADNEATIYGPPERTLFDPLVPFAGPGLTVGRALPGAWAPAWAGRRLRVSLSGIYWSGRTKDSAANATTFDDAVNISAIDGRTHQYDSYVPGKLEEVLRTRHRRAELILGLSSDFDVSARTTLTPTFALVGGWQRERYRYDAFNRVPGLGVSRPLMYDETNSTLRLGFDTGLTVATRPLAGIRLFATARAGLHWLHTRLKGRDCYDGNAGGTICDTEPGTFTNNSHATSASDSASAWSVRGSVSLGLTWDVQPFVVQVGSFFTWESAVPGIGNPYSLTRPAANGTIKLDQARVRFDDSWNLGGFLMIRLPLNEL